MYFDHKIFGHAPSFTSILQLIHGGGGRARGRNNTEHGHWMKRDEGNKRGEGKRVMLGKSYEWQWKTN